MLIAQSSVPFDVRRLRDFGPSIINVSPFPLRMIALCSGPVRCRGHDFVGESVNPAAMTIVIAGPSTESSTVS